MPPLSITFTRAGVPPLSITFTRAGVPPVSITFTRGGVSPVSITFSRGKARLLYINFYCYARTSGAAAHGAGFLRPPTRPLRCALRLLYQNLQVIFFYQTLPHLIYSLLRVDKLMDNVSERNGVSDNANRHRQLAGGVSDNANRERQLAGGASDNANRHRQLAGGASDNANRERQLAAGALYGYCIKTYKLFFLSNFTAPNI